MKVAKIINEESELRLLRDKNKNKKIVLTSGCFDLLHYGHICHLEVQEKAYVLYCSGT